MREILFRGKRIDNGEWVEGNLMGKELILPRGQILYRSPENHLVAINVVVFPVDPATVGQYTGLTDKNGKRIFEGDIIKAHTGLVLVVAFGQHLDEESEAESYGWFVSNVDRTLSLGEDWGGHEVIGNIHDNPELVKEEPT